ncbi:hypothetical protein PBI_MOZY_10 [Mycobacterium phage Mozy]|uniref:Head-to-tail connector protein n=1 Tax=Mycobacterium phage Mozy TaxID=2922213 RepID=G1D4C4_9CAUD|nr:head-tail connector protein [Mycobacterium phage Mozy]AEK09624.1 hypothetical protein PBI_MOZY_10 [Mycobacterium phage Mozy]
MASGPTKKNPLAKFGIRLDDFDKLPEVNQGVNEFMDEVAAAWKQNSPVASGDYRDLVQVTERSTNKGRGKVGATDPQAHLVEFGSVHNDEYAPAQKTAKQFGGTAYGDR